MSKSKVKSNGNTKIKSSYEGKVKTGGSSAQDSGISRASLEVSLDNADTVIDGCPILNFAFFAKFRVGMLLEVLPFETPADASYGQLRTRLEKAGIPIGANDLLIAAQALTLGYVIVTDNEREFSRVKGLRLQNWLRSTE